MFDPNEWAKRFNDNAEEAKQGRLVADFPDETVLQCHINNSVLLTELLLELLKVTVQPSDFFDRPELAAVLSAVQQIKTETPK